MTAIRLWRAVEVARIVDGILAKAGKAPDLKVTLHDWGITTEPYLAVYGQVDADDIAAWWSAHSTLFDKNLRKFIRAAAVQGDIEPQQQQQGEVVS